MSVIIPIFNAEHRLPGLLGLLAAQTYPAGQIEILCIDNNSTDGTAQVIQTWPDRRVRYLRCERQGSYAARNVGIAGARGDILAFTDEDCRPDAGWLSAALDQLVDQSVDRIAGAIHIPVSKTPGIWELVDASFYLDQARAAWQGWAATANLVMRRQALEKAGGPFNAHLISWGDIEFGLRCTAGGASIAYSPRAVVVHPPRTRAGQIMARSRRSGLGQAQINHLHLADLAQYQPQAPPPSPSVFYQSRLGWLGLGPLRRLQLTLAKFLGLDVMYSAGYLWGRWVMRQRWAAEAMAESSRREAREG